MLVLYFQEVRAVAPQRNLKAGIEVEATEEEHYFLLVPPGLLSLLFHTTQYHLLMDDTAHSGPSTAVVSQGSAPQFA